MAVAAEGSHGYGSGVGDIQSSSIPRQLAGNHVTVICPMREIHSSTGGTTTISDPYTVHVSGGITFEDVYGYEIRRDNWDYTPPEESSMVLFGEHGQTVGRIEHVVSFEEQRAIK